MDHENGNKVDDVANVKGELFLTSFKLPHLHFVATLLCIIGKICMIRIIINKVLFLISLSIIHSSRFTSILNIFMMKNKDSYLCMRLRTLFLNGHHEKFQFPWLRN